MNVSACLVTRGDVDMRPIAESLPASWEIVVWNNEQGVFRWGADGSFLMHPGRADLSVYGRYAAIEYASHDLIYVQDDDVIVSDPQAIVDALAFVGAGYRTGYREDAVICNMPQVFRPHYPDSGLVGFGAAFHRDAPQRAFSRLGDKWKAPGYWTDDERSFFQRRSDNVFTTLTPRVLVDVPKRDLPYASDSNRMWKDPGHVGERDRMIELARKVRDA